MKKKLLLCIAMGVHIWSYAQLKLSGHVSNLPDGPKLGSVVVNVPLAFGYFEDANKQLATDAAGYFNTILPLNEEKIGYLQWGNHEVFLWMRPGEDLTVELDAASGEIVFGGTMANANLLLHRLELQKAPLFYIDHRRANAAAVKDSIIRPHMEQLTTKTNLIDASPLSAGEKEFLKAELHYHFVVYFDLYVRTAKWPTDTWSTLIQDVISEETPEPKSALRGPMYYAFVDTYVDFLETRAFSARDKLPLFKTLLHATYGIESFDSLNAIYEQYGETYINWLAVKQTFDAKTAEHYLAKQVKTKFHGGELTEGKNLLDALRTSFGQSGYLSTLERSMDSLIERSVVQNDQIVIPADYRSFQSINAFVKQFAGKLVYLDVWGTWCGPCKVEMRHVQPLKERFEGKDIVFLYLDMDDDKKDAEWREYIRINALTGVHLRKNNADIQAIWSELLPADQSRHGYYPSYFLFDKNGNLVAEPVRRPSEKEALYAQLDKYLNQ
ncbi:TlpA family protein disulfide reductase [Parapedobacter sp. ISTM3]|uniref:TlpA family protein disulfide reductase n=1 Tax=Parapedobacter sp. ISTM3 TaxID=2800130 RepID=UPI00190708E1|nr:TlpA disulfide reductase family protein [Parapedobacter sp. ISTM3]MBK1442062.1 TlpA family protein disulfide reductase [Parapedobacter sp. ISTM3]